MNNIYVSSVLVFNLTTAKRGKFKQFIRKIKKIWKTMVTFPFEFWNYVKSIYHLNGGKNFFYKGSNPKFNFVYFTIYLIILDYQLHV